MAVVISDIIVNAVPGFIQLLYSYVVLKLSNNHEASSPIMYSSCNGKVNAPRHAEQIWEKKCGNRTAYIYI